MLHDNRVDVKMQPDYELVTSLRFDPKLVQVEENNLFSPNGRDCSPFYMLSYHRDRLLAAATEFGWKDAESYLQSLETFGALLDEEVQKYRKQQPLSKRDDCLKIRVAVAHPCDFSFTFSATDPTPSQRLFPDSLDEISATHESSSGGSRDGGSVWRVIIDSEATIPCQFTMYKTSQRDMYKRAQQRVDNGNVTTCNPQAPPRAADVLIYNPNGQVMETAICTIYVKQNAKWITPSLSAGGQEGTTRRWALEKGLCTEGAVDVGDLKEGQRVFLSNGVRGWIEAFIERGASGR